MNPSLNPCLEVLDFSWEVNTRKKSRQSRNNGTFEATKHTVKGQCRSAWPDLKSPWKHSTGVCRRMLPECKSEDRPWAGGITPGRGSALDERREPTPPAPTALLLCERLSRLLLPHLPHHDAVSGQTGSHKTLPLLKLIYQACCQGDRKVPNTHTEKNKQIGAFSRNERNLFLISYFVIFIKRVSWKRHFDYCLKHKFKKTIIAFPKHIPIGMPLDT